MGSLDDINSTLKNAVTNISTLASAVSSAFPRINGSFTLAAGTTTNVAQPSISASGFPVWAPTNATAALVMLTNGLFLSVVTAGVGFQVSTQSGSTLGGGTFKYLILNPS